jgi:pectin methylesterase-like acyl-CoA thioesterase
LFGISNQRRKHCPTPNRVGGATWTSGRDFEFANTGPGATVNANRPQLTTSTAANYTAAKYLAGSDGWHPVAP